MKPFSGEEEYELIFYQIKIVIKQYKTDEFVESMRSFSRKIRKEKAVLATVCIGIPKRKTPLAWLESGRHAQRWRNILGPKISK